MNDTLTYHKSRVGFQFRNMGFVALNHTVQALNEYMKTHSTLAVPEKDALWFYATNHVSSTIQSLYAQEEPLGKANELMSYYHYMLAVTTQRMFYYLLLICTRESRHAKGGTPWEVLEETYGANATNFTKALFGYSSHQAAENLRHSPPDVGIGTYTKYLVELFNTGTWSSGYGGKAWGKVAKALEQFVNGEYSAEMLMDTAFTLAHNNGPIFNKGMLYENYSKTAITAILDVQRSGQIPRMISNTESPYVDQSMREFIKRSQDVLGSRADLEGYVDWFKVEDLGSINKYTTKKSEQVSKYGAPTKVIEHEHFVIAGVLKVKKIKRVKV